MANEYATSSELKATLSLTGETFADADIALALTAASRGIDNYCNRRFYADPDATQVRYYSPDHPRVLPITDLVTLTALAVDVDGDGAFEQAWTENTHFVLEPLNAATEGKPWTTLTVHPRGGRYFPTYQPRGVRVTGKFGWAAVPDAVKEATVILASKLMRRAREAPFGVVSVGVEEGSAMRIAASDPDVNFLLRSYRRDVAIIV